MKDHVTSENKVTEPRRRASFPCGYCGRSYMLPRPRACCSRGRDWDIKIISSQQGVHVNGKASTSSNQIVDLMWDLTDDSSENAQTGEVTMTLTKEQNEKLYRLFWHLGGKYRDGLAECGWSPRRRK
jgi:hypothetical protein